MNKARILPLLLILLSISTLSLVSAAPILAANDLSGNAAQKETYTGTLTITNTGDAATITLTASDLTDGSNKIAASDISLDKRTFTLANGESTSITVSIDVDNSQEEGTYTGTITINWNDGTETGSQEATLALNVDIGNHLLIDKVTVEVDDESDKVYDGETVDDEAYPLSTITMTIAVENDYEDNVDIEDVEVEIECDSDLDCDDNDEIGTIKDGDTEEITFTFDIPSADEIDDGEYDIEITVTGTDEDGYDHEDRWTISIEVEKKKYDLRIASLSVSPGYIECDTADPQLSVKIENIGYKDIDNEGTLRITSKALKEQVVLRNLDIESEEYLTKNVLLPLKDDLAPGQYFIDVEAFTSGNEDDLTDIESTSISILQCGSKPAEEDEEQEEQEEEKDIEIVTPPSTSGNVVATATGKPDKKLIDTSSNIYLTLLVAIIVLLLILIIIAAANLMRK